MTQIWNNPVIVKDTKMSLDIRYEGEKDRFVVEIVGEENGVAARIFLDTTDIMDLRRHVDNLLVTAR